MRIAKKRFSIMVLGLRKSLVSIGSCTSVTFAMRIAGAILEHAGTDPLAKALSQ